MHVGTGQISGSTTKLGRGSFIRIQGDPLHHLFVVTQAEPASGKRKRSEAGSGYMSRRQHWCWFEEDKGELQKFKKTHWFLRIPDGLGFLMG